MARPEEPTRGGGPGDETVDSVASTARGPDAPPAGGDDTAEYTSTRAGGVGTKAAGPSPVARRHSGERPRGPAGRPVVPGHEIVRELARGGMGVVYEARHIRLGRPVALKVILAGAHASGKQLDRFAVEAQAVARLQHSGIVQIFEVGEHEGLPYFSLEFVYGGSLNRRLDGKLLPPRDAAELACTLARAVHFAHQRGFIHRDLKPGNILVTLTGEPKITDFGLAKQMDSASDVNRTGAVMGTPSYMAPEQAWGNTRDVGPWSDQYALGAILYEMLVGAPPFRGASPLETLQLVRTEECIPPTRFQPKIPVDVETICLKCLQKEPARRYADVGALAEDLQRFLDGRPILARPVGRAERLVRWCRRNPRIAGLVGTIAALLVVGAVGATGAAVHFRRLNGLLVQANADEKSARQLAEQHERDAIQARNEAEQHEREALAATSLAYKENATAVEALRVVSVLAFQRLREIPGAQALREELLRTAAKGLKRSMANVDRLHADARPRDAEGLALRTLAGINQRSGQLMEETGHIDEAGTFYREMDRLAEQLHAEAPDDAEALKVLAASKSTLGNFALNRLGDAKAALANFDAELSLRRQLAAANPDQAVVQRDVLLSYRQVGIFSLLHGRDPARARDLFGKALAAFEKRLKDEPDSLLAQQDAALLHYDYATACLRAGDRKAADEHYKACLDLREAMSRNASDRLGAIDLMIARARCGQHEQAAEMIEAMIKTPTRESRDYFQYACGFALCAGAAAGSDASLARRYADRALDALRLALRAGWKDVAEVETDPDLDPIRDDPGFAAVLDEFREAAGR